jgi:glycosyltransferase involved in cell wall biosynthesis
MSADASGRVETEPAPAQASQLVSIGVTCYNRAAGLRRLLEQLTAQTHKNLDIVVSDNCSPDPEVESAGREFAAADSRVRYFRQSSNIGANGNFYFVRDALRSEIVMFAHDDDEFTEDFVEKCLARMAGNPEIVLVGTPCTRYLNGKFLSNYEVIDNEGKQTSERLAELIVLGFRGFDLIEQYAYGLMRQDALPRDYRFTSYHTEFMVWFILAERGYIACAEGAHMKKHTTSNQMKGYEKGDWIEPQFRRLPFLHPYAEHEILAMFAMLKVILGSKKIRLVEKWRLFVLLERAFVAQTIRRIKNQRRRKRRQSLARRA